MIIRQARAADIPALVELRMRLFCEVGELDHPQADPVLWQATADYFTRAAGDESAFSWLAEADKQEGGKQIVAAGTLALFVRPPYPGNLAGVEGYLLNMYTLPEWRQQGLATALLDAITAYAKARELGKVWLHASDEGRPLYERIGFVTNPDYLEWRPGAG
ncbi:GNAT family N-acetyltransferase [Aeromonas sobria]|uniref:GNAT family N-acetyltransferase n=1 Tax=Aeromonas sobria TaxID=646 RepID=A0A1S2CQA2_AERSO|nr:GNAT family N-acetyltransferase [Aeromonas sobria]MBS4686350.1 GNAT family N-acetyltransferase [Aeromonas sobria]OHY89883.1 GNAT family N-acetyltransferase [Aeromonas sobria]